MRRESARARGRWARRLGALLAAGAVILVLGAWGADRLLGREVLFVSPRPAEAVALERSLWRRGEPVAPIYGIPAERPTRVIWFDRTRLIRPVEDPRLLLLQVDRARGDRPFQAKTLWFLARRLALLGALVAAGSLLLGLWLGRRT